MNYTLQTIKKFNQKLTTFFEAKFDGLRMSMNAGFIDLKELAAINAFSLSSLEIVLKLFPTMIPWLCSAIIKSRFSAI